MFLNHKIANVTNEPVLEAIALTMIPGIGVKGAVHLLETFGDARAVFDAPLDELTGRAELRPDLARAVTQRKGFAQAEKELRHCARNGLTVLASTDSAYPPLLHEIPDYPPVLYVMGDSSALTRRCLCLRIPPSSRRLKLASNGISTSLSANVSLRNGVLSPAARRF